MNDFDNQLHRLNRKTVKVSCGPDAPFVEGQLTVTYDYAHTAVWTVAADFISVSFTAERVEAVLVDLCRVHLLRASE